MLPRAVDEARWLDEALAPETRAHFSQVFATFNSAVWQALELPGGSRRPSIDGLAEAFAAQSDFFAPYALEGLGMALALRPELTASAPNGAESTSWFLHSLGFGMAQAFASHATPALLPGLQAEQVEDGFAFFSVMTRRAAFLAAPSRVAAELPTRTVGGWSGVGRAIWFTSASAPERIVQLVASLPRQRSGLIWRGLGLALAFTGGVPRSTLRDLRARLQPDADDLLRGVLRGVQLRAPTDFVEAAREVFL